MLVVATNQAVDHHDVGSWHPERPARTRAALDGLVSAGLSDAMVEVAPRAATRHELLAVHTPAHLARLEALDARGGGEIDQDTELVAGSLATALAAAGTGLAAVEALQAGDAEAAFVIVRPPGHHASAERSAGFCLVNNLAVTAASLLQQGERLAVIDWDVHHGNGTQSIFWDDPRLLFVSLHQRGAYPNTGWVDEVGGPHAPGTTMNLPLPAGTSGSAVRQAFDELVGPTVEAFAPTWLLVSAGFDGHRLDPLADWALTSGDYADLTTAVRSWVPSGRLVAFLEGGYDLGALGASVGAVGAALLGERHRPEASSIGTVGTADVTAIAQRWRTVVAERTA